MNQIRVHQPAKPLEDHLVERFGAVTVSSISDSLERLAGVIGLQPVGNSLSSLGGRSMVGAALTVRTRPGDNLAVHVALDLAQPGDVLVIDARGELVNAILGELMAAYAATRGIVGVVVDGAVRDRGSLSSGELPVFARGFSHLGPYKSGPGEIYGTVAVGGLTVDNGDVVVGDGDGITVIPRRRALEALEAAERVVASEAKQAQDIRAGRWDRRWLESAAQVVRVGDET